MRQRCGLGDLIPEVLNVAVPELTDLSLIRGADCAGNESKALYFVEGLGVLVTCEQRRRTGAKFAGACQGKRSDLWPLDEVGGREVRRRELIASGLVFRHERRKHSARSSVASHGKAG